MALALPSRFASYVGLCLFTALPNPVKAQDLSAQARLQAAASSDGDEVGRAVAMDSATIFAGAPGFLGAADAGQGLVFTWQRQASSNWVEGPSIPAPHPQDEQFGRSIAISTATLVVGAPSSTAASPQAGAVQVFGKYNGQEWRPVHRVIAQDGQPGDEFGHAVAIEGNTLVIGARGDSTKGPSSGAVYIFERPQQSQAWVQVAKLIAPNAEGLDYFGNAVAIKGRRIAVGAPGQDGLQPEGAPIPASDAGRVYIYEKNNETWSLQEQLVIGDPGPGDALGSSLALLDESILVGAPGVDTVNPGQNPPLIANTGAVFEYRRTNGRWRQRQILRAPDRRTNERLGSVLAVQRDQVLVGSSYTPNGDQETGIALLWKQQSEQGAWSLTGELQSSRPNDSWGHGNAVFLFQDKALVGAALATKGGGGLEEAGAVSLYQVPGAASAPTLPGALHFFSLIGMTAWLYRRRHA